MRASAHTCPPRPRVDGEQPWCGARASGWTMKPSRTATSSSCSQARFPSARRPCTSTSGSRAAPRRERFRRRSAESGRRPPRTTACHWSRCRSGCAARTQVRAESLFPAGVVAPPAPPLSGSSPLPLRTPQRTTRAEARPFGTRSWRGAPSACCRWARCKCGPLTQMTPSSRAYSACRPWRRKLAVRSRRVGHPRLAG